MSNPHRRAAMNAPDDPADDPAVTTTRSGFRSTPYRCRYSAAIPARNAGRPNATVSPKP